MSSIEDKISALLSSPDGMEKIMQVARSLGVGSDSGSSDNDENEAIQNHDEDEAAPVFHENTEKSSAPDLSGLLAAFAGGSSSKKEAEEDDSPSLDPRFVSAAMGMLSAYTKPGDHKTKLISALKPYVKNDKKRSIDRAEQALRLARVVKKALDEFGGGGSLV